MPSLEAKASGPRPSVVSVSDTLNLNCKWNARPVSPNAQQQHTLRCAHPGVHAHTHACMNTYTHHNFTSQANRHPHTHVHTPTHACTHTHTRMNTPTHALYTYPHMHVHTPTHACTHTHTQRHPRMYGHTHYASPKTQKKTTHKHSSSII